MTIQSFVPPIERVVEATQWFVRTPSLRLLYIATTGALRDVVLRHCLATELLPENRCPFFVLEAGADPADAGWNARADELREHWAHLQETAPPSSTTPPLWPALAGTTALARFAAELGAALARCPTSIMDGLVVVIAPVWARPGSRLAEDLLALLGTRELARARFIVVESGTSSVSPVAERLGSAAERVDARPEETQVIAEMAARLEAMRAAPPGSQGPRMIGAAGPDVAPPPRGAGTASTQERATASAALGIPEALLDLGALHELRILVMGAALAMRQGQPAEAVRQQRDARDLCLRKNMVREAVVNELVMAGYALQGGAQPLALATFQTARDRARSHDLGSLAAQAQMAIASCLLVARRPQDSALAYSEAGEMGARMGAPVFSIEAYRMCGQILLSLGQATEAATAFQRALDVGRVAGDSTMRASSARHAALALAALCRQHGLREQASSLEAQAAALEAPPPESTN